MVERCIAPDEIQEGDLVAYIEGVAVRRVADHIARCPACATEVAELRLTDSLMRSALSSVNEPLVDYGLVGPADRLPRVRKSRQPTVNSQRTQNWLLWPKRSAWRRIFQNVAWGLIAVIIISSLPIGFYLYNQLQLNTPSEVVREGVVATMAVTVEETAEIIKNVATKVTQTREVPPETQVVSASSPGRVIIEEMTEIAPPRSLRQRIEQEFQGQTDSLSAYSPPTAETATDDRLVMNADGQTYAVWTGRQNGRTAMYFVHSTDGGQTWSDNIEITQGFEKVFSPSLAVDTEHNHLYVVWRSGYNASTNIYLARSMNNGQTWSKKMRINEAIGRITKPSLAVDSAGSLYVTWQSHDRSNIKIYFIQSSDGGQTWSDRVLVASIGG